MRHVFLPTVILFCLTCSSWSSGQDLPTGAAAPTKKSELRVLFVGHDPAAPQVPFADMAKGRTLELYKERTPAFDAFLRERFSHVTVVYGPKYTVDMSDQVDVTIFDSRPKALTPSQRDVDPKTGQTHYKPATYLPETFTRPALTISENSPRIGEPVGLKLDWL